MTALHEAVSPAVTELLFACRKLGLDYRANPDSPDGPWRAKCPICQSTTRADELPLTITVAGHIRCAHGCDKETIADALCDALPDSKGAECETGAPSDWLAGVPMDPTAAPTEPMPALPGFPFLQAGSGAVIVGPTGGGRSSLMQVGLYDAAKAGLRGAYLGSEVTESEFNARAAMLAELRGDAIDDELREQLARVRYLNLASVIPQAWADPKAWLAGLSAAYEIVIVDPLSAVASALDLDFDRSNAEFIRFYDKLVQPYTAGGGVMALIENVGHATEARTRAKGASAKSDRADLTFSCALVSDSAGLIIKAQKVRTVRAAFRRGDEWLFERDTQRIERRATGDDGDSDQPAFRPTVLMERVSRLVQQEPGVGKKAIRTGVQGRNEYVDEALRLLIAEGYIERREDGPTHHHHHLRVFDADVASEPPCPDRAPTTVPLVPTVPQSVPTPCPPSGDDRAPRAIRRNEYGHEGSVNTSEPTAIDDALTDCEPSDDEIQRLIDDDPGLPDDWHRIEDEHFVMADEDIEF